jgi:hypothetical protein
MHKILIFIWIFEFFLKKNLILYRSIRISILSVVKKLPLNILISRGDIKGDTGLIGYTVYIYTDGLHINKMWQKRKLYFILYVLYCKLLIIT